MPAETLTTIAEISIALAGFGSVVTALRRRFDDIASVHHAQLWRMLEVSLASTAFALLPVVLDHVGLGRDAVWVIASLALACWGATATGVVLYRHREQLRNHRVLWRFNGPMLALVACGAASLVLSAFDVAIPRGPQVYVVALYGYLVLAFAMFWRLFFPTKGLE